MIRVGQKLYQERIRKGLTIDDVATATKIRPSFITAIERGEYHKIPSASYVKGFVRNYSEFLGLPSKEILALFRREYDVEKNIRVLPETYTRQNDISIRKSKIRTTILVIGGVLVLLGVFLFYQYRSAFFSPSLSVETPKEEVLTSSEIVVSGKADASAAVTVNNTPVALDMDGNFRKTITVFPGESTIVIRAKNRLGKESVVEKTITVKEE
jgi:cytoskeletal protein RodZ